MAAKKTDKTLDPLRLWSQVETTDPAHTRHVNQRGGFTAIDAQWQVLQATTAFGGPMGVGWGFDWTREDGPADLFIIRGRLWFTDPATGVEGAVEQYGAASFGQRVDADAPKKAVTDAFTKCLSLLGFSADVFLGRFDDSKYVAEQNEKHGNGKAPQPPAPKKAAAKPNGKLTKEERSRVSAAAIDRAIELKLKPSEAATIGRDSVKAMGFDQSSEIPSDKLSVLLNGIKSWKADKTEVPF
jgi:hypothetical protein